MVNALVGILFPLFVIYACVFLRTLLKEQKRGFTDADLRTAVMQGIGLFGVGFSFMILLLTALERMLIQLK